MLTSKQDHPHEPKFPSFPSTYDQVCPLQHPLTGHLCTSPKAELNTQFLPSKPEAERCPPQGTLTVCWLSRLGVGKIPRSQGSWEHEDWKDLEENLTQHHHFGYHWDPRWGKGSIKSHVTSAGTNPEHKHSSSNSGFKEFLATSQKQSEANMRVFIEHSTADALTSRTSQLGL